MDLQDWVNTVNLWSLFRSYNAAIFPLQILMLVVGTFLVYLFLKKPGSKTSIIIKSFFVFSYSWISVVYFLLFGLSRPDTLCGVLLLNATAALFGVDLSWLVVVFLLFGFGWGSPTAPFGALFFGVVAVLFGVDIVRPRTEFKPTSCRWKRCSTVLFVACAFAYPLFGLLLGHFYPSTVFFGVFPCPTTVFALALLSSSLPYVDKKVYVLLLLWASLSLYSSLCLGVYEDLILFASGVYGLVLLVKYWRVKVES